MYYIKSILSTILIVLVNVLTTECKDHYLYAVQTNYIPSDGQSLLIYDISIPEPIFNQTFLIEENIVGIVSVDKLFNDVLFLANYGDNTLLIEYNTKSNKWKKVSTVNGNGVEYSQVTQQLVFKDKSYYLSVLVNGDSYPSVLKIDFTKEVQTQIKVNLPNYDLENPHFPFLSFDEKNDLFYISYQSNVSTTNNEASFVSLDFKSTKNSRVYYGINGLNTQSIMGQFTDLQGNLYAVKNSDTYFNTIEICLINFQISQCQTKVSVYLGTEQYVNYLPYFQSQDKTKLITLTNIDDGLGGKLMQVQTFDIKTWNSTIFTIGNQWYQETGDRAPYSYCYFNFI